MRIKSMEIIAEIVLLAVIQTAILWEVTRPTTNNGSKRRLWLTYFAVFIVSGLCKWGISGAKLVSAFQLPFFVGILYWVTRKATEKSTVEILSVFGIFMLISLIADLFVLGVFHAIGRDVIRIAGEFGSREFMQGSLLSYSVQVLLARAYRRLRERKGRWNDFDERKESRVLLLALVIQFLFLLWAVFLANLQNSKVVADHMWYFYVALQIVFAAGIVLLLVKYLRDGEIKWMQERISACERRTQLVFKHYAQIEGEYRRLHHLRHDFRNLLNAASGIASAGDIHRAEEILGELKRLLDEGTRDEKK